MSKVIKLFLAIFLLASCSKKSEESNLTVVTDKGDIAYMVENAQSIPDLEKGLMFREKLAPNAGMIFDLSKVEKIAMWMKNTKIPLDMIFIDKDGVISWIFENAEPESTTLILPPFPAVAVLELNAGDVKKHNIQIGNIIKHEFFNSTSTDAVVNENATDAAQAQDAIDEMKTQAADKAEVTSQEQSDEADSKIVGDEPIPSGDEPKPEVMNE